MKYFFGFLIGIGMIVLVVMLVIRGFSGDGGKTSTTPLSDYANTDVVVRMTVDGRIIAEQQHQAYRITIGRTQTSVETLKGYQYETIENRTFDNNSESYNNLLRALDIAGFSRGNKKSQATDPRGICANGQRYTFEILDGATEIQNYWSTSCGGQGNFKGNAGQVRQLMNKQIPAADFAKTVSRLQL